MRSQVDSLCQAQKKMIKISSYEGVNGIAFDCHESDVVGVFGEPVQRSSNSEQESEFHYLDFIIRFDYLSGGFREITLLSDCVGSVNGKEIVWGDRFLDVLESEGDLVEVLGFILSLKSGIAVSGFNGDNDSHKTIHAFRYGDWDIFKNCMRPFRRSL